MPGIKTVLSIAIVMLSGCLISHHSDTTHTGTRVAAETFAQIKPGVTTRGWVASTLGPPTLVTRNDSEEVWKYVYTEHTDSSGAIFLIFGGSDSNDKSETAFVEIQNGVVINKWRG